MTVNNLVLRIRRLGEIDNGNRNVEKEGFDETASPSVVPHIFPLDLRQDQDL